MSSMLRPNALQELRIIKAASWLCGFAAAALLTACVSSDLTDVDSNAGTAVLELYSMSSSQNSTRCVITHIGDEDMRGRQSPRLTVSYIVPEGENLYQLNCENSVGSIPVHAYSFILTVNFVAGQTYMLLQEFSAGIGCIVIREKVKSKVRQAPVAEFCSPVIGQGFG
jgi:hypothetical protein